MSDEGKDPVSASPEKAADPESPTKLPENENKEEPKLDEDGLPQAPEGSKQSNISEETMEDMKALWDVFDLQSTNNVPIKELRVIMRALDFDLEPEAMNEVRYRIDPNNDGFIRFEKLVEVMEEKLKDVETAEDMME